MMKMAFSIPQTKQYVAPPIIQPLANVQTNTMIIQSPIIIQNPIIMGSIFQPIYNTGPCSSCGK